MTPSVLICLSAHDGQHWAIERVLARSYEAGDTHQATQMTMSFHSFTHMDHAKHFDRDGFTTTEITPEMTIGPAAVIDLPGGRTGPSRPPTWTHPAPTFILTTLLFCGRVGPTALREGA